MSAHTADQRTIQRDGSWLLRTAVAGVLLLAAGAFVLSYSALHAVAVAAGINPHLAGLYPLIIDGFLSIASLAALHLRDHGPRVTWYPWALLGGFFTVSVWCNALHAASRDGHVALTGPTAALVSAMPPVALGLAIHLLILMLRPSRPGTSTDDGAVDHRHAERHSRQRTSHDAGGLAPSAKPPRTTAPTRADSPRPQRAVAPRRSPAAARQPDSDDLQSRAAAALHQARRSNSELTGAQLGRQLGVSPRHGRRLLHSLNDCDSSDLREDTLEQTPPSTTAPADTTSASPVLDTQPARPAPTAVARYR